MKAPTEFKVWAGAGGAAVVSPAVLWLLGATFWHQSADALHAGAAISAVPTPVASLVTAGIAFAFGWLAPHTARPDLTPPFELRYPPAIDSDPAAAFPTPADTSADQLVVEGQAMAEPAHPTGPVAVGEVAADG